MGRRRTARGLSFGLGLGLLMAPLIGLQPPPAARAAQAAPFCAEGEMPAFVAPFDVLAAELGDLMGDPAECAHVEEAGGELLLVTTTGLAFQRAEDGAAVFTDG